MQRSRGLTPLLVILAVFGVTVAVGCSSDDPAAATKAEQLVAALHEAGLAPRMTPEVAEALYGSDAPAVCDVFEGGLGSAERLLLLGNPSNRRHKTITDHAVQYARIVVETYCPEHGERFRDVVDDLDPYASDLSERSEA